MFCVPPLSPHQFHQRLLLFPPHVTDEETEAQRGLVQGQTACKDFRASCCHSAPTPSQDARPWLWAGPQQALGGCGALRPGLRTRCQGGRGRCLPALPPVAGPVPLCPPPQSATFLWWGCGCPAVFAQSLCRLLSEPQPGLSQQAGPPCHSLHIPITRKLVAGSEGETRFPSNGRGDLGFTPGDTG